VNEVDEDAHLRTARVALIMDQVQLVAGTVDQHHPFPLPVRITALGLVEHRADDLFSVAFDGGGQPLRLRPGAFGAIRAICVVATSDHIAGFTRHRREVVDRADGRHPFAPVLLSAGQARGERPAPTSRLLRGGPPGLLTQCFRPHDDPLAVRRWHQQHLLGVGVGVGVGVGAGVGANRGSLARRDESLSCTQY
jgi:hypothetical protein